MTTNAKIGYGTTFAIQSGSPLDYVTIAEVTNITPPNLARDAVDATHTASEEGWREFIPGLKDAGEVSIELNFVPGSESTALLMEAFNADDPVSCKITFPDSPATEWTFAAIMTGFETEAPVDDKLTATATFKLSGKPTLGG